ncbi:MAG: hypothetical protein OER86_06305, partial [Phycisphaerae bacterium]|nr:hypothetical protein [Phycisphaerae bacterium]
SPRDNHRVAGPPTTGWPRLTAACLLAIGAVALPSAPAQSAEPRWASMDLGPTFSSTFNVNGETPKGLAVRLGEKGEAGILYDEDLLRVAAVWTGKFVKINGGRNALLGNDNIGERARLGAPRLPGWSKDGSLADPREPYRNKTWGPLPRDWARYGGLYMHGNRVVLKYTVGSATVLEQPWAETAGGRTIFTRTFEISGLKKASDVVIARDNRVKIEDGIARGENVLAAIVGDTNRVNLALGDQNLLVARVSPGAAPFRVLFTDGAKDGLNDFKARVAKAEKPTQLTPMTRGSAPRWPQKLKTAGKLGTGDGAYVVDTITPPFDNPYKSILHFGGHDFLSDGTGVICTMEGDVWLVDGIDADLDELSWQRVATGMYHPLGVKVVKDKIYVICRDQITRLHDLNGDREIDFYECFNNDIHAGMNSHEFATSLETDPEGNFFYCKGTNGNQTKHDSSVIKVSKDGSKLTRYATGFRWPNGMGMSPTGAVTVGDQQGTWVPSSRLDWIERDGFYGFLNSHHRETAPTTYDGPLCWIPHPTDNSCGGQTWVEGDKWGPLKDKMLHLSYGRCLLFLVLDEKIGKTRQGGVIQIPVAKFDSGAMRARFHPGDGQLYVSGLQGWQTSGARDGCFQRVRHTGKKVYLPTGLNVTRSGLRLHFDQPLDRKYVEDIESYAVEIWNYRWTKGYGSKQYLVSDPNKTGHDKVEVKSAKLLPDGKSVFVELAEVKPVMQMSIAFDLRAADGTKMRGTIYNTIHVMAND